MKKKYILGVAACLLLTGCTQKAKTSDVSSVASEAASSEVVLTNEEITALYEAQQTKSLAKAKEVVASDFISAKLTNTSKGSLSIVYNEKEMGAFSEDITTTIIANVDNAAIKNNADETKTAIADKTAFYMNVKGTASEKVYQTVDSTTQTMIEAKTDSTLLYTAASGKAYAVTNSNFGEKKQEGGYVFQVAPYDAVAAGVYASIITSDNMEATIAQYIEQAMTMLEGMIGGEGDSDSEVIAPSKATMIAAVAIELVPEVIETIRKCEEEKKTTEETVNAVADLIIKALDISENDKDLKEFKEEGLPKIVVIVDAVKAIDFSSMVKMTYKDSKFTFAIDFDNVNTAISNFLTTVYTKFIAMTTNDAQQKASIEKEYAEIMAEMKKMPKVTAAYEITFKDDLPYATKTTMTYDGGIPFINAISDEDETLESAKFLYKSTFKANFEETTTVEIGKTEVTIPSVDVSKCVPFQGIAK